MSGGLGRALAAMVGRLRLVGWLALAAVLGSTVAVAFVVLSTPTITLQDVRSPRTPAAEAAPTDPASPRPGAAPPSSAGTQPAAPGQQAPAVGPSIAAEAPAPTAPPSESAPPAAPAPPGVADQGKGDSAPGPQTGRSKSKP